MASRAKDIRAIRSSGNVFADLEVGELEKVRLKAELASWISETIERRGLSQAEAAEILGADQPKVSALVRGELYGFSLERLLEYMTALGLDIEIAVRERVGSREPGRIVFRHAG